MDKITNKRILLIISGGIAAYKTPELLRRFMKLGARVSVVLTRGAEHFVSGLSLSGVSGESVHTSLFKSRRGDGMDHIALSRQADLVVVAPATADLMAKMACGLADDLASSCLLAANKPILLAPAMNTQMWHNNATKRNYQQLTADGVMFVGPERGEMACGEYGIGRMSEIDTIVARVGAFFGDQPSQKVFSILKGKRVLITSGATIEPIDPVRFISNRSSGKQGSAIARAFVDLGCEVIFITGRASAPVPDDCRVIVVETAQDMYRAAMTNLPVDVAVFVAAVVDWRVSKRFTGKIKKKGQAPELNLVNNPDILAEIAGLADDTRPQLVIGFAAETDNIIKNAQAKIATKRCDWLLANDVSSSSGVFGGNRNKVTLLKNGLPKPISWPLLEKWEVGEKLAGEVEKYFSNEGKLT